MPAYAVFIKERDRDAEEMATYAGLAPATTTGHEFKALAVYGAVQTLEGPEVAGALIFEFPTVAAARAWYDSESYTEAKKHRHLGADYRVFILEGV